MRQPRPGWDGSGLCVLAGRAVRVLCGHARARSHELAGSGGQQVGAGSCMRWEAVVKCGIWNDIVLLASMARCPGCVDRRTAPLRCMPRALASFRGTMHAPEGEGASYPEHTHTPVGAVCLLLQHWNCDNKPSIRCNATEPRGGCPPSPCSAYGLAWPARTAAMLTSVAQLSDVACGAQRSTHNNKSIKHSAVLMLQALKALVCHGGLQRQSQSAL